MPSADGQSWATTEPVVLGEPLGETPMGPGAFVARRYRVVRALGEGGMGQVFEADHVGLGRSVALKVVRSCSPSGSSTIERFEREARAPLTRVGVATRSHGSALSEVSGSPGV